MTDIFALFKKIEKKEDRGPISAIVVGLGNPGAKYTETRHNAGFLAIDYMAKELGVKIDRAKFSALVCEASIGEHRVLLRKPETFMNNSGVAIAAAKDFYKISNDRIIVLHDEITQEPGIIRIRRKGSAGGHNGLKSIIASVGGDDFPRVKIGVGAKPSPEYDLVDWVLGKFPRAALDGMSARFSDIMSSVRLMLDGKIDEAMNKYSK